MILDEGTDETIYKHFGINGVDLMRWAKKVRNQWRAGKTLAS
jgi:hypothetical protein